MSEILNLERSGKSNEGERDINVKERKGEKRRKTSHRDEDLRGVGIDVLIELFSCLSVLPRVLLHRYECVIDDAGDVDSTVCYRRRCFVAVDDWKHLKHKQDETVRVT